METIDCDRPLQKTRNAFKVVCAHPRLIRNNRRTSYVELFAAVNYEPGKTTYPLAGCGPLCVFESLEDARDYICRHAFIDSYTLAEVWECTVVESDERYVYNGHSDRIATHYYKLPKGTILAKSVTLTKQVV